MRGRVSDVRVCDVWWIVMAGGLSPGPGVHIWGAAVWCLHWGRVTNRIPGAGGTGGPTRGEANTNIMSALSVGCNKTLCSNNNSDFRLGIYKYLHVLLSSVQGGGRVWRVSRWSLSSWLVSPASPSPPVNTILTVPIPSPALTGTNCHNCSLNESLFVPITPVGAGLSRRKALLPRKDFPFAVSQCLGQVFSLLPFLLSNRDIQQNL